jgi:hypothetical protein
MARIKAPVVITANDLLTGEVVYLDPAHQWSPELSAANVFNALDEAEGELAAAFSEAVVVGAYLAEVSNDVAVTPGTIANLFVTQDRATTFTVSRRFKTQRSLRNVQLSRV